MENIISKMGLYDLFARGFTGAIILCAADLFGIMNILDSGISVWVIILGGYFLGLVLEELSYLLEGILKSRVAAHENPDSSTNPGMDTDDYVFLLSVDEVKYYLPSNSDRMCSPTEYAVKQGAFRNESLGTCWWWLRTPGETSQDASSVNSDGTIDTDDGSVNSNKGCVRPAMWVRIGD